MRSSKWVDRRDPRKWRVPTIVASFCPDVSWSLLPASPSSTIVTMPRLLSINPHVEFIPQRALGATDLVHNTFLTLLRILLLAHLPIGWIIEIQTLGKFFSGGGGIMFFKKHRKNFMYFLRNFIHWYWKSTHLTCKIMYKCWKQKQKSVKNKSFSLIWSHFKPFTHLCCE